jgi:hypothetical protein
MMIEAASRRAAGAWHASDSVWPATFGLACCAMELISTAAGPRHDLARFGMERASNTPRQADLMIVAGRVSQKMAPVLRQIYDQMSEPKWVISMGVCASSDGMFNNYAIVLPAAAGDADGRDPQAPRQDPEHEARSQPGTPDHRARAGPASAAAASAGDQPMTVAGAGRDQPVMSRTASACWQMFLQGSATVAAGGAQGRLRQPLTLSQPGASSRIGSGAIRRFS